MPKCFLIASIIALIIALALVAGCSAMSERSPQADNGKAQNAIPVVDKSMDPGSDDYAAEVANYPEDSSGSLEAPAPEIIAQRDLWIVEKQDGIICKDVPTQGEIRSDAEEGKKRLPLKHTDVSAKISAFVAVVDVTQRFYNPYPKNIEAYYIFPLPRNAAVTDFTITIGKRRIRGMVREREQAQKIYRAAKKQGYRAVLISQQQPDVFTCQATIASQESIDVKIRYFNTLEYLNGEYEFMFPMAENKGRSDTRSGLDISLRVDIDAGVKIEEIYANHSISVSKNGNRAEVVLKTRNRIANRNFVLRYRVAGDKLKMAMLTCRDKFALILQPPKIDDASRDKPALGSIEIHWNGVWTEDVYPKNLSQVFAGKPAVITGRYKGSGRAVIQVIGQTGGETKSYAIRVDLNDKNASHPGIELLWAKNKLDYLLKRRPAAYSPKLKRAAIDLAIQYNILCPLTAFLIVDTLKKIGNGEVNRVNVNVYTNGQ